MPELSTKGEGGRRAAQAESTAKNLPVLSFATARAWSEWLVTHHASSRGLWLKIAKKGSGSASVTYAGALEGALAWGWIDGQKGTFNNVWWLQRFTPRTAKSPWSKINRAKAETLIAAGTMEAPGLAEVERAKRDGRWKRAYDGARSSSVPPDLVAAFARNARARDFFETLDGANRYAILYRVQTAKKPETRAERITRFVALCARHETIHPRRQTKSGARPRGASRKARTKE
ncbi:MAG TPA: YdeI/OmpD-associated family protein [Steroidobacteraceae bacterium]